MAVTPTDVPAGPGFPIRLFAPLALGGIVAAVILFAFLSQRQSPLSPPQEEPASFPLTPISTSPFLNTGADAHYIGSEACRSCHGDRHASFRRTGMGRSMAAVDPSREPAGTTYDHALSKRRYHIETRDGKMWHREELLAPGAKGVTLSDFPMLYVVGSGRHSRTYLCEADGFLVESPATWYTSKKAWGMSPGYDRANQRGFDREIGMECLICHAGRVEPVDGTLHRMSVIEAPIGCERCHGPGSLHAERHRKGKEKFAAETDLTIVNPRHLSRELAESICQQCHLRPTAAVLARGRDLTEFRPGLPIQDFLHTFQSKAEAAQMTVVGHVEQLHMSRCYQKSATLTCVTCHDPHGEPRPEERVQYYRLACLTCHEPQHCKVSETRRKKESPDNDCAKCHMPSSETEIPHLAFSHHRIGIHDRSTAVPPTSEDLEEFLPLARFSEVDRKRSLRLGYLEAANREKDVRRAARYREEAKGLLTDVRSAGLRDPMVKANLARIHFDLARADECPPEVFSFAESALKLPGIRTQERVMALYFQAAGLAARNQHAEAIGSLRELTRLRRHPADWLLMAECQNAVGREKEWIEALELVARIDPRMTRAHAVLADYFQRLGNKEKSAWHRVRAVP